MATIASNVFLGVPVSANGANESAGSGDSSDFMQLVQGMIQGNTSGEQLPSNLLQLLLTGDTGGLDGILDADATGDKDSTDASDGSDAAEAAAASGLAALLAGLQPVPQTSVSNATTGDNTGIGSIDASGSQGDAQTLKTLQALLATSQSALTAAFDDAKEASSAAAKDAAAPSTDATAATNSPANNTGAAHLQNTLLAHRTADVAPQAASAEVKTPVGAPGWSDEIGTHLAIMAANGREAASLRLSPEHLGPLEIQISVKDGQANVVFGASNPDTRNALEQSLPRLREMFAAQGLTLGNANVSRDAPRDAFKPATHTGSSRGSSDASGELSVKSVTLSRLGLVDTYV